MNLRTIPSGAQDDPRNTFSAAKASKTWGNSKVCFVLVFALEASFGLPKRPKPEENARFALVFYRSESTVRKNKFLLVRELDFCAAEGVQKTVKGI